jgi:hypothetical protein
VKRLKRIKIRSRWFSITYDTTTFGGSFSGDDPEITVGTQWGDDNAINLVLLHECIEVLLVELAYRGTTSNGEYRFVMNHDEYSTFIVDLYDVMNQLYPPCKKKIKEKKNDK